MPKQPRTSTEPEKTAFKDRDEEIKSILSLVADVPLLNVYGVAGIGKSRLLEEAFLRLRQQEPQAILIIVDLDKLPADVERPRALLKALLAQEPTRLQVTSPEPDRAAAQVVVQLNDIAARTKPQLPVYLFVDTTERAQEDMGFWSWTENNLVGPLAVAGHVRQVFAGRIPAPWRRFEVRRAVQLLSLGPVSPEEAARALIGEVLQRVNPELQMEALRPVVSSLLDLSFGHPMLSEELAAYTAPCLPRALQQLEAFQRELCEQVAIPYINSYLLKDVPPPWPQILRWASVLHQFDPLLLRRYLEKLEPALVADKPDHFFVQGLVTLRIRYTTVWHAGEGTVVHGILREILRKNLQVLYSDDFRRACRAAAAVYDELAGEFPPESEEAACYRQEAERYRRESHAIGSGEEEN